MTREGALAQGWNWMLAASVAAKRDLSPVFAGEWKLPITDETRAALKKIDWNKNHLTLKEVTGSVTPIWKDNLP
jgi:hypothetical protein